MIIKKEDQEAVRKDYPYTVTRLSYRNLALDIGEWLMHIPGEDHVIISRVLQGSSINFSPILLITHGFRREEDALAFSIRFCHEVVR